MPIRNTALLPAALLHSRAASASRRTTTRGSASPSTSEATPTRSAAASPASVPMLGLPRAVSIWITVPRLTPAAAASASMVIRRCWRSARTLRPTAVATSSDCMRTVCRTETDISLYAEHGGP